MSTPFSTAHAVSPDSGLHWTEPGAWPVADGVHRIPLPLPMDGLRAVNVYVLETEQGLTLVDAGWAVRESRELLERSLAEMGRTPADITRFLVTHVHRDHYTQAVTVRREFGAHISLGLGDKPTLDLIHEPDPEGDPYLRMMRRAGGHRIAEAMAAFLAESLPDVGLWGYPDAWLDRDHALEVGSRTLEAVHTPGHTQGHFVFADRAAGLLFAGDHVLPTITPSIGFEPQPASLPLGDFLASLAKVRALPDLTLLPAHGPVADSSHARVDELIAHHAHRLALCRAAVPAAGATAYTTAHELPWTRHDLAFDDLDLFNAAMATMETRAHLELLVARGELRVEETTAGAVYSPVV
ncbi:MAG TPA: MBL fold metallo-hydrolase [Nocardioides sp.]|uniref:MBL fold metallo-hydrolase n=1 Tax=Nocardioides sp. TaxID=35761 RepID=UPI002D13DC0C|nr:MBL fold metallo-hydrolase [Nocardioides sp.]HQR27567.1 MBL fold metallo-hydrolase [Nocardioides sp.]